MRVSLAPLLQRVPGWPCLRVVRPDPFIAALSLAAPCRPLCLATQGGTLYRCRKCRRVLATSSNVVPVEAAMGHKVFRDRQRTRREEAAGGASAHHHGDGGTKAGGGAEDGAAVFVEPMSWMAAMVVGAPQGKLYCPGPACNARLGSFNWAGGAADCCLCWVCCAVLCQQQTRLLSQSMVRCTSVAAMCCELVAHHPCSSVHPARTLDLCCGLLLGYLHWSGLLAEDLTGLWPSLTTCPTP